MPISLDFFLLIDISLSCPIRSFFYLLKFGPNYYFLTNLRSLDLIFSLGILLGVLY